MSAGRSFHKLGVASRNDRLGRVFFFYFKQGKGRVVKAVTAVRAKEVRSDNSREH